MDAGLVIALVLTAPVLLIVFAVARMVWRMARGTEELEPGGPMGRQLTASTKDRRPA